MTPRGIRNNNPLNIKKGNNFQGEQHPQTDPEFEQFLSMAHGIRAGFKILKNYIRNGYNTPELIIRRWCPDNTAETYIQTVCTRSGLSRTGRLAFQDSTRMCDLVEAMCYVECGRPIDKRVISTAYYMSI